MATESPIRIPGTSGKWPSHREATLFVPSSTSMAAEELGLLRRTHMIHGSGRDVVPSRSGSAPPSMEGSFLAIDNLLSQQNFGLNSSFPSLNGATENRESEELLRADPSYLAYYCSNVNLNPRLPPPLISWENQRLVRHIGRFGNNWGLTFIDDDGNGSLHLSQGALSTHKEESEDDSSPQQSSDDILDRTNGFWSGQDAASLAGPQQNSVDLIQEDFPHASSPVHSQLHSLSYEITEEAGDCDAGLSSLHDPPVSVSNAVSSTADADNAGVSSDADPSAASISSSSSRDCAGTTSSTQTFQKGGPNNTDIHSESEVFVGNVRNSDVPTILTEMKNLNISNLPNLENKKTQRERQQNCHDVLLQHQQQNNSFQVQSSKSQMSSQGVNGAYVGTDQFHHGSSKFSSEVQPVLQSSGFTPPLYTTAAAYMTSPTPFYPNVQAPGLFSPQYGVGGYPLNSSVFPPFIAGYPPHGAIPLVFDSAAGPDFSAQMSGVSSGGNVVHGVDLHYLNKFYGQVGFTMQPSFADPLYLQYYQQPFGQAYNMPGQIEPLASRGGGIAGSQKSALNSQKGSDVTASLDDQKFHHQSSAGLGNQNPDRGGIMSPHYYGNQVNMGILMQYSSSPLTSPVLPGSPAGATNLPGWRNETRYPPGSGRYAGVCSGWQGQRGFESFNDPKIYNFLEDLKSGKGRRFELSDIAGHIVEFSADQHGSRFIQQKLENCSVEEKASVFKEVLPHASKLMTDVFGNYVIQKFFEYGSSEQRKELAYQLTGQILPLSLQMYGCRVIQKALEVIEPEQKAQLVSELDGHVLRCVRDQNGNHVIQKCIESIPTDKIGFIISAFRGQVATLSMHPYGCRVIQRVLEHCTDEFQCQFIVDEILESVCALAQDQYGNYVTQHVLERGKPHERGKIIRKLSGHIVQLSQHKFASNVVEKCLEYGGPTERELIINEIVGHNEGNSNLLTMMKDQFANYVVQKIFERCTENQRELLLSRIRMHAHGLKKYTYGKHIVARFEQLFGEESQISGS